jgi:uncharacterized repeat protein (TIGR02543 family)
LKGWITTTVVAICVVFAAIAISTLVGGVSASSGPNSNSLNLTYDNGLTGNSNSQITRSVSLTLNSDDNTYETAANTTKMLTIDQAGFKNSGYTFNGWTLTVNDTQTPTDGTYVPAGLTQSDSVVFTATWTKNAVVVPPAAQYSITLNQSANGTISSSQSCSVTAGTQVTIIAKPATGYQVCGWSISGATVISGAGTSTSAVISVTGDVNVTVTFGQIPVTYYTLTVSSTCGSNVGPFNTDTETYAAGTTISFYTDSSASSLNNYNGYTFSCFQINGQTYYPTNGVFNYTLTGDVTITVVYTKN